MRKKTPLITSIGEPVADFVSTKNRVTLAQSPGFVKVGGGEAANVAVGIARLGTHSAFIGKVGNDSFGRFLTEELARHDVNVCGIVFDEDHKTRLAFISLTATGERDFEFWEQHPAGEHLKYAEVRMDSITRSRMVNIGALLLLKEPSRSAAFRIAAAARMKRCAITFDPNLRLALWKSRKEAQQVTLKMITISNILRMNEDEGKFLTGSSSLRGMAKKIRKLGPELVVITRGSKGCYFQTADAEGLVPGFQVRTVDTTGCGDGFFAGLLHQLASIPDIPSLSSRQLTSMCRYANAVGALTSLKRGAVPGMPRNSEVKRLLRARTR